MPRPRLVDGPVPAGVDEVNVAILETVSALSQRLQGPAPRERAILATVDLPYGAIRRRLLGGRPPRPSLDGPVAAAARAILTHRRA